MKKSNLIVGVVYVLAGIACLCSALLFETKLEGILWGLFGAAFSSGLIMLCRFFYWSSPQNSDRYEERMEKEQIEMHDELKTMVRDKAGRYTYVLSLTVVCFSILIFGILDALGVVCNARTLVLYLGGFLVFQVIAGIFIFNKLMKKF